MMLAEKLNTYRFILGSKSPRRKILMEGLGIPFEVLVRDVAEECPDDLSGIETARYLAKLKAAAFSEELKNPSVIVMTADTVVWHQGEHLAKPADSEEAAGMLRKLSGDQHEVITGVCLSCGTKHKVFHSLTQVWFKKLSAEEIDYYVTNYKPFDKAGAYGVQEWIGHIGITKIEGSYFNVVGLPVQKVYEELCDFLS